MTEPSCLFSLPFEVRQIIWGYSLGDRIFEIGEPGDPDILPESDLRKAWVLNRKMPTIAHLCHESREFTKQQVLCESSGVNPDCVGDRRVCLKYNTTVHFNAPPNFKLLDQDARFDFADKLNGAIDVWDMGKQLSISADILHPFLRFHEALPREEQNLAQNLFIKLKELTVALHTVCIRATKQQARDMGVFGLGEEPAQLLDPFDRRVIRQYKTLWDQTIIQDVSAMKFFDTVFTSRFTFRVERWLSEIEAMYIKLKWINLPTMRPSATVVILNLGSNPEYRHRQETRQYLEEFPKLDLRIMFRLCPPAVTVDNVIT
jgi:hypothetical protein